MADEVPMNYDLDWDEVINPRFGRPTRWDRAGQPISMRRWAELREDETWKSFRRNRLVAQDRVGRYQVSTVWLGDDYSVVPFGLPIIFETMVFERRLARGTYGHLHYPSVAGLCCRYATERQALRGHYEMRRLVRQMIHEAHGPKPATARARRGR